MASTTESFLDRILDHKRAEVEQRRRDVSLEALVERCVTAPGPRSLAAALRQPGRATLIAEVKKASPSKGVLVENFDPFALAQVYTDNGAAAISVLTDERFFQGSLEYLGGIRMQQEAVNSQQSAVNADVELATGNWQPATGNWQPATGNWQLATGNRQPATGDWQLATGDRQPATGNRQPATGNWQLATGNWQPATGNWRLVAGNQQPATANPPLLRKDFIIDPYQVYEARAYGADALLLIVAALNDDMLGALLAQTRELGMEALVEVHNEAELDRALRAGATIIGVNNRDLHTFVTTLETTERVAARLPDPRPVLVSESGIFSAADVARVRACGADAVLVGEALVKAEDTAARVRELAGVVDRHATD